MTDVKPFSPVPTDLALVSRLAKQQFLMDSVTALAKGTNPLESALLSAVPLADLGLPTLILREEDHGYLAQLRHRAQDRHAQIVCLAPLPTDAHDESCWLHLIDGLTEVAARRGALIIRAEVPEREQTAIELLRLAGFSVTTRQTIYRYAPGSDLYPVAPRRVSLRWVNDNDTNRILGLIGNLVPSLVQQAVPCGEQNRFHGMVVESNDDGKIVGYLDIVEGKSGLIIKPFLHPDIFDEEATRVFAEVLRLLPKAEKLPVYFVALSFQEWLRLPFESLGLDVSERQAIFVKHVVAKIRQTDEIAKSARELIFGSLVNAIDIRENDS